MEGISANSRPRRNNSPRPSISCYTCDYGICTSCSSRALGHQSLFKKFFKWFNYKYRSAFISLIRGNIVLFPSPYPYIIYTNSRKSQYLKNQFLCQVGRSRILLGMRARLPPRLASCRPPLLYAHDCYESPVVRLDVAGMLFAYMAEAVMDSRRTFSWIEILGSIRINTLGSSRLARRLCQSEAKQEGGPLMEALLETVLPAFGRPHISTLIIPLMARKGGCGGLPTAPAKIRRKIKLPNIFFAFLQICYICAIGKGSAGYKVELNKQKNNGYLPLSVGREPS